MPTVEVVLASPSGVKVTALLSEAPGAMMTEDDDSVPLLAVSGTVNVVQALGVICTRTLLKSSMTGVKVTANEALVLSRNRKVVRLPELLKNSAGRLVN